MESRQMTEDQSNNAGHFVGCDSISLFFTDIETLIAIMSEDRHSDRSIIPDD